MIEEQTTAIATLLDLKKARKDRREANSERVNATTTAETKSTASLEAKPDEGAFSRHGVLCLRV